MKDDDAFIQVVDLVYNINQAGKSRKYSKEDYLSIIIEDKITNPLLYLFIKVKFYLFIYINIYFLR